jgi:hypothetical protein
MRHKIVWLVIALTLIIAGCTNGVVPISPTPTPTAAVALSATALKYILIQKFGPVSGDKTPSSTIFYCDPDLYPVSRGTEKELALERFPKIQSDTEEFPILLKHLGLVNVTQFSDAQKLLIYQEFKRLNAIRLEAAGEIFRFQLSSRSEQNEFTVEGTIDKYGTINILKRESTWLACPVCLARNIQIDTPNGAVAVQDLHEGMVVWTLNAKGNRVTAVIVWTTRASVPANTQLIHVVLDDGRELVASPRHPLADNRAIGTLFVGDKVDGASVTLLENIPYDDATTYDILPSGDTGLYWANGILVGSTLHSSLNR